jgi:hypothetical protein
MANWDGHKPVTSAALLALLTRARAGGESFSYAERMLCTASEFWTAARNRTLSQLLADDAESQLRAAEDAFTAMGVVGVTMVLRIGRINLTAVHPPVPFKQMAEFMEEALAHIDEPVDELIAVFAREWILDRRI